MAVRWHLGRLHWGTVSSLLDSGVGSNLLAGVLLLEFNDAAASVQLGTEHLILLDEVAQLSGEVTILGGQDGHVRGQGVLLLHLFLLLRGQVATDGAGALVVFVRAEEGGLQSLQLLFGLADVQAEFGISGLQALEFLSQFDVFGVEFTVIAPEALHGGLEGSDLVTELGELALGLDESSLLGT